MIRHRDDYRWDGEVSPLRDVFAAIRPSARYSSEIGGAKREFEVATREDYETILRESGHLRTGTALVDAPDLVAAAQAHWHADGNNGCRFAMYLSENRRACGWESWVMAERGDSQAEAMAIDARVRTSLEPAEVDVVSVILPHVEGASRFGEIVLALGDLEQWRVSDQGGVSDLRHGDLQFVGLSLSIELEHWSEVLGFGSGESLANTRRAPFTELAIRAKPPRRPRRDHRANMADVDLGLNGEAKDAWWQDTKRRRAERLGEEHDARGKARITTVVQKTTGAR